MARLETYDAAKKVLNKAGEKLPKEPAAKLKEANENTPLWLGRLSKGVFGLLQRKGVEIDREAWMKEAEAAERAGSVATCNAIDYIWLKAAQLEKAHGTRESLDVLLRKAVSYTPQAEVLWLMDAKEKWLAGDVPAARHMLLEAYRAIPDYEEIWLAAFKLEELGNTEEERRLLNEGLELFPSVFKLRLMFGQLEERLPQAKEAYELGLKQCLNATPLWLAAIRTEARHGSKKEADILMAKALQECPNNGILWAANIEMATRPPIQGKSGDALKRCEHDSHGGCQTVLA
ncbi:protein stabilized1 [Tanacetum coccineum]